MARVLRLSKVRDSLPATLRQHMDTGGIRMSITCVTNGSIVVEFDLLITVAVDVGVVSATFLDALGNMSQLEVVRNDTFIWGRQTWECRCPPLISGQEPHCDPRAFGRQVPMLALPRIQWKMQIGWDAPCVSHCTIAVSEV